MEAQHQQKMIRSAIDLFFKGALGISMLDLTILFMNQTPAIDLVIGKWLQVLFTTIGIIYFIASWPHKRKMQLLEREMKEQELEKLTRENDEHPGN